MSLVKNTTVSSLTSYPLNPEGNSEAENQAKCFPIFTFEQPARFLRPEFGDADKTPTLAAATVAFRQKTKQQLWIYMRI